MEIPQDYEARVKLEENVLGCPALAWKQCPRCEKIMGLVTHNWQYAGWYYQCDCGYLETADLPDIRETEKNPLYWCEKCWYLGKGETDFLRKCRRASVMECFFNRTEFGWEKQTGFPKLRGFHAKYLPKPAYIPQTNPPEEF